MWRTNPPVKNGTYMAYTKDGVKTLTYNRRWRQPVLAWKPLPGYTVSVSRKVIFTGIGLLLLGLILARCFIRSWIVLAAPPLAFGLFLLLLAVPGFWSVSFNGDDAVFSRLWIKRRYKTNELKWTERREGYEASVNEEPIMTIFDKKKLCGILKLMEN